MNALANKLEEKLVSVAKTEGVYHPDAYCFVFFLICELDVGKFESPLSAMEIMRGLKVMGWLEYGLLAPEVFKKWGVKEGKDFGFIIYHLVEAGLLKKSQNESIQDFTRGFSFDYTDYDYWSIEDDKDIIKYIKSHK
jgi:uncharacterized repeat protein (TIGR04138 family)